jgi:hypothetical protein
MSAPAVAAGDREFDAAFFDEASAAWRANKRHTGNCFYVYVCSAPGCGDDARTRIVAHGAEPLLCYAHRVGVAPPRRGERQSAAVVVDGVRRSARLAAAAAAVTSATR